jgi:hypothetical protein
VAVSRTVISAYRRCYSVPQLEEALRVALHDRATGVLVTQVSFQDGAGSGTPITGDPNEIIEILELTLQQIESGAEPNAAPPPMTAPINFNRRRSET